MSNGRLAALGNPHPYLNEVTLTPRFPGHGH